jgi:hypothetical protein
MDDLFRFLLLRPADLPADDDVKVLEPTHLDTGRGRQLARREAAKLLASKTLLRRTEDLRYGDLALTVRAALDAGTVPAAALQDLVKKRSGKRATDLTGDDRFAAEEGSLADTLVAAKLVSGTPDLDARGLAAAAQGYDALRRLADGADPVGLRPLQMPSFEPTDEQDHRYDDRRLDHPASAAAPQQSAGDRRTAQTASGDEHEQLRRIEDAIAAVSSVRAQDFDAESAASTAEGAVAGLAARVGRLEAEVGDGGDAPRGNDAPAQGSWRLRASAVEGLPGQVRETLQRLRIDPTTTALPQVVEALHTARVQAETAAARGYATTVEQLTKVGSSFVSAAKGSDYVGTPGTSMPTGHGSVKPVGIGDLLIVKQHVLRYEGGEVAHVENVLKSEVLDRETRRLDRTETTVLTETERTKEEERDNQSTDRFSLKRETSETLKSETEFKAGVQVDAKYGTFVEVKASADFATKSSSEESTKQASEFSKDVVARSVSKVVERVLERRSTTTISEFEEKYRHGFDNTGGTGNISGVYQWVDKVLQAQVYNYGKRMLFDVTVPEPGTAFVVAQAADKQSDPIVKPTPFTLTADQITEGNYTLYARQYDVTGLEAPPPPVKTVAKAIDALLPDGDHETTKSIEVVLDDGYQASYAFFQRDWLKYSDGSFRVLVGRNWIDALGGTGYVTMDAEVGSVAIAVKAHQVRELAATIEIFCTRTARAYKAW